MTVSWPFLHFPEMGELVIAAAGRSRIAMRLHGKTRHDQSTHQPVERPGIAVPETGRIAKPGQEIVLHHRKGGWIQCFLAEGVGHDPVGAGHQLACEIAVAPGSHRRGRRGNHVGIGHDRDRGGACEGSLEAAFAQRGARSGVTVHRRRRRHADIGRAGNLGGIFDEIVDDAGADGDGKCGTRAQRRCQRTRCFGARFHARFFVEHDRIAGGETSR